MDILVKPKAYVTFLEFLQIYPQAVGSENAFHICVVLKWMTSTIECDLHTQHRSSGIKTSERLITIIHYWL